MVSQKLTVLYIFLFIGFLFGKYKKEQAGQTSILSFLLVSLFLPCKVFSTFSVNFTVSYLRENYTTFFLSTGLLLLLALLAKGISALLTKNPYKRNVYRYSFTIPNYAYIGYILAEDLFGQEGLTNLISFCIPFALYTYTFGFVLLTKKGSMLKKLCNPMTFAIAAGMLFGLTGISVPASIQDVLTASSACVGPLSMILTGFVLSEFSLKALVLDKNAYIVSLFRLVILPAAIFALCRGIRLVIALPPAVFPSAVIMACMPCGLNTVVFPRLVGEDCKEGARLAFISLLFSCITIPLWMSFLQ